MAEEFKDITLTCVDCGKEFVWTTGEQAYYKEHEFENEPKRCADCRRARKQRSRSNFRRNDR